METLPDQGRATFPRTLEEVGQPFRRRPEPSATFPRKPETVVPDGVDAVLDHRGRDRHLPMLLRAARATGADGTDPAQAEIDPGYGALDD